MKSFIVFILFSSLLFAQENEALKYFPYKTGDMWEYFWYDLQFPDTLQNFNIKDSVDADGNIFVTQYSRFINPISPGALLPDTAVYKIDTSFNVFCLTCEFENELLYKLNAQRGDQWVIWDYHGGGYEMARVSDVWEDEILGVQTVFKTYKYYYAQDSTDTLGILARYGADLAEGFGLTWMGSGEAIGSIYLIGSVIDNILYGDTTSITAVTDLPDNIPLQFELYPNYPNPFNPSTTISFDLNIANNISLIVYDAMGREIKRLTDYEFFYPGKHQIVWDGKNNSNQSVSSGVYYYKLFFGSTNKTRSMILLK